MSQFAVIGLIGRVFRVYLIDHCFRVLYLLTPSNFVQLGPVNIMTKEKKNPRNVKEERKRNEGIKYSRRICVCCPISRETERDGIASLASKDLLLLLRLKTKPVIAVCVTGFLRKIFFPAWSAREAFSASRRCKKIAIGGNSRSLPNAR